MKFFESNRGFGDFFGSLVLFKSITAGVVLKVVNLQIGSVADGFDWFALWAWLDVVLLMDSDKTDARRRCVEQRLLELRLQSAVCSVGPSLPSILLLFHPSLMLSAKLGWDKVRRRGWTTRCFDIVSDTADGWYHTFCIIHIHTGSLTHSRRDRERSTQKTSTIASNPTQTEFLFVGISCGMIASVEPSTITSVNYLTHIDCWVYRRSPFLQLIGLKRIRRAFRTRQKWDDERLCLFVADKKSSLLVFN